MAQEIAVFAIVAAAFANLIRIWGGTAKGDTGCGKCPSSGGCEPKKSAPSAPQMVQLQMNLKPKGE